ncbi:hypothetical protein DTO271G3_7313 [Paecilomyces variotii]|nr:hypothetical protein DTO271G3_7313 [Paecilomyces variotii]
MVADAVIYHPAVAHYLRFVATTVGRDKLLRTLQYFSRFYAWYLFRTNRPKTAIEPFETIKKQFGLTRKILRIGKFIEHFKAAAVAFDNKAPVDPILRYLAVGRQLGYAGYMSYDTITVIHALGIKKLQNPKKMQENAYRAWLASLVFSVISGVYSLWKLHQREKLVDRTEGEGAVELKKIQKERAAARVQLISDLFDITIPISGTGIVPLDDGIVGLSGTVSSLLGIWSAWKKTA